LARHAIDSGADLIIGSHPHVIQGITSYKGKTIVYSLGNFCFGGNRNPSDKDTFIFQKKLTFENEYLTRAESFIIPASVSSLKSRNDYRPTPLAGKDAERVKDRLIKYSSKLNDGKDVITPIFTVFEP
jgi:poly-gamma-glutamate synthesis protein (capsule biosynthesis protein)